MQQLVEHHAPLFGHLSAHIVACIFARQCLGKRAQHFEVITQLYIVKFALFTHSAELFSRIIYQRAKAATGVLAYLGFKQLAHLFEDDAGAVVENVPHCAVFAVQVADKMLRAHRQRHYRPKLDYLRAH